MENNSENNFRDFFRNNIDFLFILDMEGNIIETNNTVCSALGYTTEELVGKSVLLVHPPEFRTEAAETVSKMITGVKALCPIPLLTKSHEYIPVETRVFPGTWNSNTALIGVSRNMSEHKLSEEKFYRVFNNSNVLMAISTVTSGVFINANKQFLETLGYTKDEIIGTESKHLDLFFDYKQREKVFELLEKEGHVDNIESVIKTKSGKLLTCLFSINKIKIQTYEFILTSATNITQLKAAEAKISYLYKQQKLLADISQLLNKSTNLEQILDNVLALIGEHTSVSRVYIFEDIKNGTATSNTFEWCNSGITPQIQDLQGIPYEVIPSWKKLLLDEGRIFSKNIEELPRDLYHILAPQEIKSVLAYPLYVQHLYYGFIGLDDCISNKTWTAEEIDLMRTVSNIIANAFERKQVLKKLEDSELRLTLAIQSANEGLWDWYNQTGYVYFSDIWCRMLGYEPNEIKQHISSWEKLTHPDDIPMIEESLNKHFNGESDYYETIHRLKAKDGGWKWIMDHGMVIQRDSNHKPVRMVGTHIDITKQKEIEQRLKELVETKDKLFSIIAHDLRGPIGSFLPILNILTSGEELDETTKNKFLEELKNASKNTFNLLENLLNWSRSQTNKITITPQNFEINSLINDNVELLRANANQKGISIGVAAEKSIVAYADMDSINLVIRNLLTNALKFTPTNGAIQIAAADRGNRIEVAISDTGIGMGKEIIGKLFRPNSFYSTRGTNKEKGAGIGLILCKDFVEKNGGKIRVESTPCQGSKFFFTIPKGCLAN